MWEGDNYIYNGGGVGVGGLVWLEVDFVSHAMVLEVRLDTNESHIR